MSEPQSALPLPRPRRRAPEAQPAPANPINSVAHTLRTAREANGQDIGEIAEILKIRRLYLQAIEEADWASLPEMVYAQGFVRSYANYLGLDGTAITLQFKREFRGGPRKPELDMPQPIEDNQVPSFKIIGGVLIGLALIYVLWALAYPHQKSEAVPPAPIETAAPPVAQPPLTTAAPVVLAAPAIAATNNASAALSTPAAPAVMAPSPATVPQPQLAAPPQSTTPHPPQTGTAYGSPTATRVTITAVQDSWVQVRAADGQVAFSRVLRPGDYYRVPPDAGLTLTTGNLSGLNFDIDNQNMTPPGAPGTVLRNVPLTPETLSAGLNTLIKNSKANVNQ